MTSCIPTGDGRDITPEDDEHIKWFNLGLRTARAKAKRELKCPQCGISNGTCSCYLVRELTGQSKDCKTCGGKGYTLSDPTKKILPPIFHDECPDCNGTGKAPNPRQSKEPTYDELVKLAGAGFAAYQADHPEPQPNTDSLEGGDFINALGNILAQHGKFIVGVERQRDPVKGMSTREAKDALEQLFNKYAMERVIDTLDELMDKRGQRVWVNPKRSIVAVDCGDLETERRRLIAELKEQRAKLKEENSGTD